jgi:hypothetical protein
VSSPKPEPELQGAFALGMLAGALLTLVCGALGLYVGSCSLLTRPEPYVPPPLVLQGTIPDRHHDEDSGP